MSLMAINRTAKKYGTLVGAVMAFLMIGGVVLSGLGGNIGGGAGRRPGIPGIGSEPAVATVGDRKITKPELDQFAERMAQQQSMQNPMAMGKQPAPEEMDSFRLQAINIFKQQQALQSVAKQAGITISDADLQAERDKKWADGTRAAIAQQLGLAPDADDNKIEAALLKLGNGATLDAVKQQVLPDESVRLSASIDKLSTQYKTQIAVDEAAVRRSLSDMTVRHILVKFGTGALPEAQAKTKAEKLLAAVKADSTKMGDLAKANSDDPGSKAKGGVYEWAPADRKGIVPEFSAALDKLKPGETYPELVRVSNPGYSGFHIIRLEATKPGKEFPKDFDKNKAQYIATYAKERIDKRVQEAVDAATPAVKVVITDPSLQAEQYIEDAQKAASKADSDAKLNLALTELSKIKKEDDPLGIAPLKRARVLTQLGKTKDAIAAYEDALTYRSTPETRLALAQAYVADKQNDKAKDQLAKMEEGVIPDPQMENGVAQLYSQLGETAKAKAAGEKAKEMSKRQMEDLMKQYQQQQPPASQAPAPTPKPTK